MPSAPPRICARCRRPAPAGARCPCTPAWENSRHPGNSHRTQRNRRQQLRDQPFCQAPGCNRLADEVDHIIPLAEGGDRYDPANLQSLCRDHHKQKTTADALRGKTRKR